MLKLVYSCAVVCCLLLKLWNVELFYRNWWLKDSVTECGSGDYLRWCQTLHWTTSVRQQCLFRHLSYQRSVSCHHLDILCLLSNKCICVTISILHLSFVIHFNAAAAASIRSKVMKHFITCNSMIAIEMFLLLSFASDWILLTEHLV